jgi:hypothetical protein
MNMVLDFNIPPGPHEFKIMHPFDDIELKAHFGEHEQIVIDQELIFRMPHGARFFIDDTEVGRMIDVFKEMENV